MLRLPGGVLLVLPVREVGSALHPVQQLDLLVQGGKHFVDVAVSERAGELLVRRPLRQLPGPDTREQLADGAAQRER